MSQARVTDFFVQRKHGAGGGSRAKEQKTHSSLVDNGVLQIAKPKTRSTRSKNKVSVSITKTPRSTRSDKAIADEFLRVINEATLADVPGVLARTESKTPSLLQSPKTTDFKTPSLPQTPTKTDSKTPSLLQSPQTPKRTSADAEFDLGSALFSATADHSTAKKKRRVEATKSANALENEIEVKPVKKSARKKLNLSKDNEQAAQQEKNGDVQLVSNPPHSVDKVPKNIVNDGIDSSPTTRAPSKKSVTRHKALSKDDVAALKSQCQRIKNISEKQPSPAPESVTAPGLKATLARAKELAARAQQRKERTAEVASATVEQAQTQPQADAGENQPAYQRYHALAQDVPPGLSLPYMFKLLADSFRSMDTIVGMLYNRSETVTFAKVKQGVQDMTRKRFEETHVGQIKTVYPSAYTFRQEKNIPTFSAAIKKSCYQLTMEPILEASEGAGKSETRPLLSASRLLERRHVFHRSLVDIVKDHHKEFLSSLNLPMTVPDDKLTRWHPRFNVDEVPAPKPSPLPQPPQTEKLTTAQEVLDKARSLMTPKSSILSNFVHFLDGSDTVYGLGYGVMWVAEDGALTELRCSKMEKALTNMALKTAEPEGVPPQPTTPAPALNPADTPRALKGVPQSLLERIRAKEAQKLLATMTRNPKQEERLLMMSRLEELARILRNVFVSEKKPALIMELACNRMIASYRSALSTGDMEKHLRLLAELVPEWLVIHPIRKDFFLKLNKATDLSIVQEKLNRKIKEEERL